VLELGEGDLFVQPSGVEASALEFAADEAVGVVRFAVNRRGGDHDLVVEAWILFHQLGPA